MFQTPENDDIYVRDHPCSPVIFPGGCLGGGVGAWVGGWVVGHDGNKTNSAPN